ncbi:MAG: hypothetical protein HRU75_08310 [Planctomycetia bacterium]|nr:MAG: hypothetical protein HRU75_08310 [Planctomycetia bacterium]
MTTASPTRTVLVLGHDSRAFLAIIRSLGRAGLNVHVGWHRPDSVALRSRYVRKRCALPPFHESSDEWLGALLELLQRERYDLVFPCNDAAMTAFHRHRDALGAHARLCIPDTRSFEVLFDKIRTNELARAQGLTLPAERVVASREEAAGAIEALGLPIVLKPRQSYNPENPDEKLMVWKAYTREVFDRALASLLRAGPVTLQRNFVGVGVGVEVLMRDGEPLLIFQHERVHEPLYGGGSSYRRSVALDPRLVDETRRLLGALRYTGVAMAEFKLNPRTREFVFIEVNARFWGSLPLAVAAGANFPLGAYQLLVEGQVRVPSRGRVGIYCRNWYHDLAWIRANVRADKRDPTLATRPLWRVLADRVRNQLLLRERSDTFAWDDPAPALAEARQIASMLAKQTSNALHRRWLSSPIGRRRESLRAARVLKSARSVLFVCKGNICRSPFAEVQLRALQPTITVASAGYYPRSGRPSPAHAVTAAAEHGLDLSAHRSQRLTRELVDQYHAVCVFDHENLMTVRSEFPDAAGKIVLLGALDGGGLFISDPWGGELPRFRACYDRIRAALTRWPAASG